MNNKTYKSLFVMLTIIALAANSASIVSANNDEKENKNESTKKLTQQIKKIAELNNELYKDSVDSEKSVSAVQPASVTINPNGEVKLNGAEAITTAASASSTTLSVRVWGITFTLALDSGSKVKARGGAIAPSQIQVGDKLNITGLANAATPLTIRVKQLDDMTLNVVNSGSNDELVRLRAQIQALMDKLNALLARVGGNATTTPNPVVVPVVIPTLTSISPATSTASSTAFTLSVNGTNFATSSVINWGNTALATAFVSGTQLTAVVPAANIATAVSTIITVTTPGIGGGTSNGIIFSAQ